jgi:hypothetical protein
MNLKMRTFKGLPSTLLARAIFDAIITAKNISRKIKSKTIPLRVPTMRVPTALESHCSGPTGVSMDSYR